MKVDTFEDEELGVLEDKTETLALHSKRTERVQKKQRKRAMTVQDSPDGFMSLLPYELMLEILTLLKPSDLFRLQRASKSFYAFIAQEEATIAKIVSSWRYACLEQCFRLPVLITDIDPALHPLLNLPELQEIMAIHNMSYYQHVRLPDPTEVCTCLTCTPRWTALALVVDFSHWQRHLDAGEPIPMIARGRSPDWNQALVDTHATIVHKALYSPLWHARLLEAHLDSTTRSIRRHAANKGNRGRRFHLTDKDVATGTDAFLSRIGPPSVDFPYNRDTYYLLETYMPARCWSRKESCWLYIPAEQHEWDLQLAIRRAEHKQKAALERQADNATEENNEQQS